MLSRLQFRVLPDMQGEAGARGQVTVRVSSGIFPKEGGRMRVSSCRLPYVHADASCHGLRAGRTASASLLRGHTRPRPLWIGDEVVSCELVDE